MYYITCVVIVLKLLTPIFDNMPPYMWIIGGIALGYQMIQEQVNKDKK